MKKGGKVLFTFNSTYALKNEITVRIKWKVAVAFFMDIFICSFFFIAGVISQYYPAVQSISPGIQPAEKRDSIGKQMITQMHHELSNALIRAENVHCKLTLLII